MFGAIRGPILIVQSRAVLACLACTDPLEIGTHFETIGQPVRPKAGVVAPDHPASAKVLRYQGSLQRDRPVTTTS